MVDQVLQGYTGLGTQAFLDRTHRFLAPLYASILIAICAPLSIPLPFTPVPLAIAPHLVLLLSCFLGGKRAAAACLLYLLEGASGLPVFAGGAGGVLHLIGPKGGYLIGYVVAAYVTGTLYQRLKTERASSLLGVLLLGNLLIYLCGVSYLAGFLGVEKALLLGCAPFLVTDLFKLLLVQRILKGSRRFQAAFFLKS